jgi:hypothetical protein
VTGAFQSGEALLDAGVLVLQAGTADTALALKPGGKFQFANGNFAGSTATFYMYLCDGVNFLSEFDGTRLVPIRTGIRGDAPKFLSIWKNMLVAALDSSVEVSGIGLPYSWTALTGAAEMALGAPCTGLKPQISSQAGGVLAIFTAAQTFMLYGNSAADFNLVIQSPDSGAQPYSCQNIGFAYYMDTKGVQQVNSSRNFGNFEMATLTRVIQPIIDAHRGMVVASCVVRGGNQIRFFFSDGTGIIVYMQKKSAESIGGTVLLGDEVGGITPFDYSVMGTGWYLNTVESIIDVNGIEQILASGSDGYAYTLDKGTSFDGNNIFSHMLLAFNSSKTPRNSKHYKRTTLHAKVLGTANLNIGYDLSYGSSAANPGVRSANTLLGGGGLWDVFTWDQFNWDTAAVGEFVVDTPGDGINIALLMYGDTDQDLPYTMQDAILQYVIRRQMR